MLNLGTKGTFGVVVTRSGPMVSFPKINEVEEEKEPKIPRKKVICMKNEETNWEKWNK